VHSKRSSSTGMRTGLGRGEGLDLDVGAVDELPYGKVDPLLRKIK